MSRITRRDALAHLATAFAGAAAVDYALGADVHALVAQTFVDGVYTPKALSAAQYAALERLTDLIVPAENGRPGAVDARVPAWIDALLAVNTELAATFVSGLAWLDTAIAARGAATFASATPVDQTAVLDVIAFKRNTAPDVDAGIAFFALARRMTVDGFYTSEPGIREIIPGGRPPLPAFIVPQEAVDYVLNRSPFK